MLSSDQLTPVHQVGHYFVKRDDFFVCAGVNGGKARTCWALAQGATGLVTAGARSSPQNNIVARIARKLGIPARCHMPQGTLGLQAQLAQAAGATITQHKAGYNSVIIKRAHDDAVEHNYTEIPFGMECREAVRQTQRQTSNLYLAGGAKRIVVPVGSGMSLAGILTGLLSSARQTPVLGVRVGADPTKRLDKYAPPLWRSMCTIVEAKVPYHKAADITDFGGIELDSIYEGKCLDFMRPGDLLWIVGSRMKNGGNYDEQATS